MRTDELIASLRKLTPEFRCIEGCYLMRVGKPFPAAAALRDSLQRFYKGDVTRAERDMNRCFIVNLLDEIVDDKERDGEDLVFIADFFAKLVRDGLRSFFPHERFDVEVVGANLVDAEPLELCVTFSRIL